jgi:hypothetical protein
VGRTVSLPTDFLRIKELLHGQPDLLMDFWTSTIARLRPFFKLMLERTGDMHTARIAFGIVIASVMSAMARPESDDTSTIRDRVLSGVRTMRDLIAEVEL